MSSGHMTYQPDKLRWREFVAGRAARLGFASVLSMVDGDQNAANRVTSWITGKGCPTATVRSTSAAMDTIHATGEEVVSILWPDLAGRTLPDALAIIHASRQREMGDRGNAAARAKWALLEPAKKSARMEQKNHSRTRLAAKRAAGGLDTNTGKPLTAHGQRCSDGRRALAAMSPQQRAEYRKGKRQQCRSKARSELKPWAWKSGVLASIRRSLREIRARVERCEAIWEHEAARALLPWFRAGFKTHRAWFRTTPEGKEAQRLEWQVRSKGHRQSQRRKMKGSGTFPKSAWLQMLKDWSYHCAYCNRHRREFRNAARREDIEMDHILPIGHAQFTHTAANIVPACKTCNASKGDNDLISWAMRRSITLDCRVLAQYDQLTKAKHA